MLWARSLKRIHHIQMHGYVSGCCISLHAPGRSTPHMQTCRIQQSVLQGVDEVRRHYQMQQRSVMLISPSIQIINQRCYDTWQPKTSFHSVGLNSCHGNHALHSSQDDEFLIYKLPIRKYRQLLFVSFFTYGLALYWFYLAPDVIVGALEHDTLNWETAAELLALLWSTFILPSVVHHFRKQLVLKVYHKYAQESYTVVTQNATLRQATKEFLLQDIIRTSSGKVYTLRTKFKVNGKRYLVYPAYFSRPADYNHMMGFNIPKS